MKTLSKVFKVLTVLLSLGLVTLFFFPLFSVVTEAGSVPLSGFEIAFGSTKTVGGNVVNTYKGAWYAFAFVVSALSLVFSALCFKKKGSGYASVGFSFAAMISMIVFASFPSHFVDWRPLAKTGMQNELFPVALIVAIAAFVISVVSLLVTDYAEVMESKGAKLTIPRRIANFFKDYKSEIKKVVWPSRETVVKNTLIVLVMCAIVGIYVAALDFGLAKLIGLILGLDL